KTEAELLSEGEKEYLELDTEGGESKANIIVRPFVINDFSDIKEILDSLREGYTIALINIRPLKDKDLVDLKRAINKLKKTCDAIDGDIAGFGEDYIVVTPSFAKIYRCKHTGAVKSE
ncbi:MAG: cell division protein SepF, partial [Nanoarchaeota archaeon]|nr:cell division protein SepF [Nanoarchaeota archaeon]